MRLKHSGARYPYEKVRDKRNRSIRGLWIRNGVFYARLNLTDPQTGVRATRRLRLENADGQPVQTVPQAVAELRRLMTERERGELRPMRRTPSFSEYLDTHLERLPHSGIKPRSVLAAIAYLKPWRTALGGLRLSDIRAHHITHHLAERMARGAANRTRNTALTMLNGVLKAAQADGYIRTLPTEGIARLKAPQVQRRLYTADEIDRLVRTTLTGTKTGKRGRIPLAANGRMLADFIRFLQYTGAREQEALLVRWADVDLERGQVVIGAKADSTKNREARHVDFSPALEAHLQDMASRRPPDSEWLFPSPRRGDRDCPARTLRNALHVVRPVAGLPRFGFHDLRHFFVSYAVMSNTDFLTIARWVGHRDGGVLIGRVYGHLADEHRKRMAAQLAFGIRAASPSTVTELEETA
jgi:integrase